MANQILHPDIKFLRSEVRSLEKENDQLKIKIAEMEEYVNHVKSSLFKAVKQNRELREMLQLKR